MLIVYCYNKCSTCRKALNFLDSNQIRYVLKDIVTEHPNKEEMEQIIQKSGLEIKKFFNTSGNLYKKLHLKDKLNEMNDEEKIQLLISNGMLIKRPLVVGPDIVLRGFKEEEWKKLI